MNLEIKLQRGLRPDCNNVRLLAQEQADKLHVQTPPLRNAMTSRLPQRLFPLLLLLAFSVPPAYGAPPASGDLAPDYVGKTLAGDQLAVSAHRGKVVVISFWATWCPYCLKELSVLEGIQKVAGANKVQVIAVNTEDRQVFRD